MPIIPWEENGPGHSFLWQFDTPEEEAVGLAREIDGLICRGVRPRDIIVLATSKEAARCITDELSRREVAAVSLFGEGAITDDQARHNLELLRLSIDHHDRVALRWLLGEGRPDWANSPYQQMRECCEHGALHPWDALAACLDAPLFYALPDVLVERFQEIREQIGEVRAKENLYEKIDHLFAGEAHVRELAEVILSSVPDGEVEQGRFLAELTRLVAIPEITVGQDDVRVMSLHKSKGLSAPFTFVAGCIDGLLPRHQPKVGIDAEEQRRLFYVAITRVQAVSDELRERPGVLAMSFATHLEWAQVHAAQIEDATGDGHRARVQMSPFIDELGSAVPELVRRTASDPLYLAMFPAM